MFHQIRGEGVLIFLSENTGIEPGSPGPLPVSLTAVLPRPYLKKSLDISKKKWDKKKFLNFVKCFITYSSISHVVIPIQTEQSQESPTKTNKLKYQLKNTIICIVSVRERVVMIYEEEVWGKEWWGMKNVTTRCRGPRHPPPQYRSLWSLHTQTQPN